MKLYSSNKDYELYSGSMLDMLDVLEENSIDAIVTDPPYELNFMNKGWDNTGIAFQKATWEKCLKVLKPGGHLLAFGGSRTYHRIAVAIEDAGFELRDTIQWIYGSGMPKSMNIGLALDKKNGVESPVVGQNEAILKKQAKDVSDEFGNPISPEQYDSLQREIVETEQELQNLTEQRKQIDDQKASSEEIMRRLEAHA